MPAGGFRAAGYFAGSLKKTIAIRAIHIQLVALLQWFEPNSLCRGAGNLRARRREFFAGDREFSKPRGKGSARAGGVATARRAPPDRLEYCCSRSGAAVQAAL